jgi:hypothetical protein
VVLRLPDLGDPVATFGGTSEVDAELDDPAETDRPAFANCRMWGGGAGSAGRLGVAHRAGAQGSTRSTRCTHQWGSLVRGVRIPARIPPNASTPRVGPYTAMTRRAFPDSSQQDAREQEALGESVSWPREMR